ncbi:hypothetical protein [Cellulomonas timonensis]|uniref:hypothetical protein n=1 Tax=Cellulomonas timonensis TaxID=1689271 RepID=UPI0008358640|nr:hypothetical protein [Cellulomonas timonensis]
MNRIALDLSGVGHGGERAHVAVAGLIGQPGTTTARLGPPWAHASPTRSSEYAAAGASRAPSAMSRMMRGSSAIVRSAETEPTPLPTIRKRSQSDAARYSLEARDAMVGDDAPLVVAAGHARGDEDARFERQLAIVLTGIGAQLGS